ncbi:hypothetical protein SNE40_010408 [Patella caerulea]|uniref:Uncharacterized protein n=1 Tax=Patella caerulea TaxID=87958 RepID=A0AAN8K0Z4_PATCE
MTSTPDLDYMSSVGVRYNSAKSARMSTRRNLSKSAPPSRTQFSLKRQESKADILDGKLNRMQEPPQLHREKTQVLDELLLLYGVNSYKYFNFGRMTSTWISEIRPRIGTAWLCDNEAFRQMYSTSVIYPKKRLVSASCSKVTLPTVSTSNSSPTPSRLTTRV